MSKASDKQLQKTLTRAITVIKEECYGITRITNFYFLAIYKKKIDVNPSEKYQGTTKARFDSGWGRIDNSFYCIVLIYC